MHLSPRKGPNPKGLVAVDVQPLLQPALRADKNRSGTIRRLAYEIGTFDLTVADQNGKSAASRGKYVVAWKKQANGEWKAAADIFNTDQ